MANPFDYRESMKVAFGLSDKTLEQLERERKARDREPSKPAKGRSQPAPTSDSKPRQSELDKLSALMSSAKPRLKPLGE